VRPPGGPASGVTETVKVRSPGSALAGTVTWKCSVTVCPGSMVTGAGLVTVQPAGAFRVNCACCIA